MFESVRSRASHRWQKRKMDAENKMYERYAGKRLHRLPQPLTKPVIAMFVILAGFLYYLMVNMVFYGLITRWEFLGMLGGIVFITFIGIIVVSSHTAAGRTLKVKIGPAPGFVADGFLPGQNVKDLTLTGTDDHGKEFDDKHFFEIGWGGALKRWPFRGRGPAFILLCQYNLDKKEGSPQAGFVYGDEYIVPLQPRLYRMDWLEATRDSRYADMLKNTEGISKFIHDGTWVVLATLPMPLPDRKEITGPAISDKEFWHEKRIRRRISDNLHEIGKDDRKSAAIGVGRLGR